MRLSNGLLVLAVAMFLAACTHDMRIVNRQEFEASARAERSLTLAVETDAVAEDTEKLVDAVKEALAAHSSVQRVAFIKEAPPDFTPDFVVMVRPATDYEGSAWNYPITFPGFLVFVHAWNGFVYKADVKTEVAIRTPGAEQPFASDTIATRWNLRHCDFERGVWTSSGWYTPFYGALSIFIGFFMVPYDEDATPYFLSEVKEPYGRFVAAKIIEMAAKAPPPSTVQGGAIEPAEPEPTQAAPDAAPPVAP